MVLRPEPTQPSLSLDTLADKQLHRLEKSATTKRAGYIPSLPQSVLQAVIDADAVAALPLVLAIHRQLTMAKRKETPLNGAIWKCAGLPSPKCRGRILRTLKTIPHVIRITVARTATTHYRVAKGKSWPEA